MRNKKGQFIKGFKNGFEENLKLGCGWNKGTHITNSGSFKKGHKHNSEVIKKLKKSLKERVSPRKGVKLSAEQKKKMKFFEKGHLPWNKGLGDKTPENKRIWRSIEMRLWREAVFTRDNYTCQKCEQHGGTLRPHHIFNFATYLDLRFDITNGITLCDKCHQAFHKKYGNRNNTKEQLEEFIGQNA